MTNGILILICLLALAVLFTTLAPLTNSTAWWVRAWDFPRIHIGIVAVLVGLAAVVALPAWGWAIAVTMLACTAYHAVRVYPYTSFARLEIPVSQDPAPAKQVSLLSVNVLMENTRHADLIEIIDETDPDVLFLMETDDTWADALQTVLDRYPTVLRHPLDNYYGAIFATRLPAPQAEVVFLADDNTPSVLAELEAPTGSFFFVGLHPRPPTPGVDTDERDEQIKRAARIADRNRLPVVAMGDFNDVAWSYTSERFKRYGEFRDPRVGRGLIASFDARSYWMRFPIDQLYLTEGFELVSFSTLRAFGSDHYPMHANIIVEPR